MIEFHRVLANMVTLYPFLVGVWGLVIYLRRQAPSGNFNGALVIAEILFVIEAALGVILLLMGLQPARAVHFLYGITGVLALPLAFTMTRGRNDNRAALIYGLTLMFLWGVADRAIDTALHAGP